jgi:hypothetical protein
MKKTILFLFLYLLLFIGFGQSDFTIEKCVRHLASPQLQGRDVNTRGDSLAQVYIINTFKAMGIAPYFDTYTQPFCKKMKVIRGGDNICGKNIIGFIEGTDSILKKEVVIICAHYDHVGVQNWKMHPGANDNASGVSAILHMAKKFKENPTKRSIMIICFGAEEKGLLGSYYFVQNAPFPLKTINFVVNFDMIGKYRQEGYVYYKGDKTVLAFPALIEKYAPKYNLKYDESPGSYLNGSDHYPFYKKRVPILVFNTGMDWDNYHRPSDIPEKIDFQGIEMIANMMFDIITDLSNQPEKVKFKKK